MELATGGEGLQKDLGKLAQPQGRERCLKPGDFPPALKLGPNKEDREGYRNNPRKAWRAGGSACRGHQGQDPWPACPTADDGEQEFLQRTRVAESRGTHAQTLPCRQCVRGLVSNNSTARKTYAINPEKSAVINHRDVRSLVPRGARQRKSRIAMGDV